MKKNYKLSKIVIVRISRVHVPYLGYAIIKGPKGGTIVIDKYNFEMLLYKVEPRLRMHRVEPGILGYAAKSHIAKYVTSLDTSDSGINNIAKELKADKLIRNNNRDLFQKMVDKLDVDDLVQHLLMSLID